MMYGSTDIKFHRESGIYENALLFSQYDFVTADYCHIFLSLHTVCVNVQAYRLILNQIVGNKESPIVYNIYNSLKFDNRIRQNRSITGH